MELIEQFWRKWPKLLQQMNTTAAKRSPFHSTLSTAKVFGGKFSILKMEMNLLLVIV